MKTTFYLATLVMFASSAVVSHAELIAWDSFATTAGGDDYNLGPIGGQNPTVGCDEFNGAWNSGTKHPAAAHGGLTHKLTPRTPLDGLLVPYTEDIGWANRRLSRAIEYTPSDGTYYMSVLLQKDHATNGDLAAGLAPLESTNWSFSSIQGTYIGLEQGNISFLTTSTLYHLTPANEVNIGETYFALMQFDYSTSGPDTVTATVYDGSSTEIASHPFTGLNLDGDIGRFGLITSDLAPTVAVDEWRFGMELSDVMVVPTNGDFDGDGDVDGNDCLAWQRGEVSTPPSAEDLALWKDQFGTTSVLSLSTSVPEPGSIVLLLVAFLCSLRRRRLT